MQGSDSSLDSSKHEEGALCVGMDESHNHIETN